MTHKETKKAVSESERMWKQAWNILFRGAEDLGRGQRKKTDKRKTEVRPWLTGQESSTKEFFKPLWVADNTQSVGNTQSVLESIPMFFSELGQNTNQNQQVGEICFFVTSYRPTIRKLMWELKQKTGKNFLT